MNLEDILLRGTRAAQPTASSVAEGQLYSVIDEGYKVEQSRGGAWLPYAGSGSGFSGGQVANFPFFPESAEFNDEPFVIPTPISIPAAGGGGGSWTLIESRVPTGVAVEDFITNLDFNEILILLVQVVPFSSDTFLCRVSIDGGVSYLTTSGDYKSINSNSIEANVNGMLFSGSAAVTAKTCWMTIMNFNGTTNPKIVNGAEPSTFAKIFRIPTTSPLNGIRVAAQVGTFTAVGEIFIFGR